MGEEKIKGISRYFFSVHYEAVTIPCPQPQAKRATYFLQWAWQSPRALTFLAHWSTMHSLLLDGGRWEEKIDEE